MKQNYLLFENSFISLRKVVKDIDNPSILEELHKDEEELHRDESRIKAAFIAVAIFMLALTTGVSYLIFKSFTKDSTDAIGIIAQDIPPSITITPTASPTSTLTTPSPTPTAGKKTADEQAISVAKDYYINLGSGTNKSTDWEDVAGTLTTADIGQYQNIKEVHLETTIDVPTANGTVSVRLFNKTDNYAVWNSERTVQAEKKGNLLISQNLIYDIGPKLYQVQIKSQLGVLANLLQARIHIVAN